ncbi:UNVERIFIED_CONTAM: hypothetical protein Slati_0854400 [Sesamum latifolium]|uniref:Integrase catalytic domain-containing protein n=1 Tax=Sesamum latifolium TaxID=2727402 RepID=A0AAW2XM75_9LAMI
MTKKPFVGQSAIANRLLDLVHIDVCGPLSIPARGGFSYFITFTDDHSRYGYIYLMRYKSEALGRFKEYRLEVENQTNRKIKALQSDRGGEYLSVHTDGVLVLRRSTREFRAPEWYEFVGLTSQLNNDLKTYGEAISDIDSDKWLEAMKFEMDSMGSNQVWTLVDHPKGVRPVGCKWVYKRKLGADGEVTAFKARLMAKGYTQRLGVDFEETYSPVAMAKSIRILLAIYGLKQASRSWSTHFDEVIRGYDFIKNEYDLEANGLVYM